VEYLEGRTLLSNFSVTNLNDAGDGSLRLAIIQSNSTAGPNEIDFAAGLSGTISLTGGQLTIANNDVTIVGPGLDSLSVSGNGKSRVFEIATGVTASLSGLTITGGSADNGGGIENHGTVTISACTISGNSALPSGAGGGIFTTGTATITNTTISNNSAFDGGGIFNDRGTVTITACAISGSSTPLHGIGGGIANIFGTLTIVDSTISGISASGGGGIYNDRGTVSIINSTINNNTAGTGGGISNDVGTLTIINSTINGNSGLPSSIGGGIIDTVGGGIFTTGTPTITDTTISNNSGGVNFGGGIFNAGTLKTTNTTISGNSAIVGGGSFNYHDNINLGTVTITACSLSGNSATDEGGGISNGEGHFYDNIGTVIIGNTILAGNFAPSSPDDLGPLVSRGHNLVGIGAGGSGYTDSDLVGTVESPIDPLLGPLQDNGGPRFTHALLPGSPAIDAGSNALIPTGVKYDQRGPGFQRIVNGTVDIGAYEFLPAVNHAVAVGWGTQTASLQTAADGLRLLPVGRSTDLPWLGINQLQLTLGQAQSLTPGDVTVNSAIGAKYGPVTVSGSGTNYSIALARPINAADRVTLTIVNPGISMFNRRINVLPGDVNDDGVVNVQDAVLVRNAILKTGDPSMIGWVDVDGNGVIDTNDLTAVRKRLGTHLQ
jgi:hypothetical protein